LKIDKLLFLALILFTTPSYSIIYYLTGKYVPNHIFGYLIIVSIVLSKKSFPIDPLKLLISLILVIYIIFISLYNSFLNITSLHFIFVILCLVIINKKLNIDLNIIKKIVVFQAILVVIQTVLMNFGFNDFLNSLMTYPAQVKDYYFANWFSVFFRVPGGFKESSQLAAFMVISLFLNEGCKVTKILGTMSIIMSGSILGFVGLIIFSMIKIKNYFYKIITVAISIVLVVPLLIWRITYSKLFNDQIEGTGGDRFSNLYFSITGNNFSYLGNGIEYYRGNDFLSIYMPSVGIIGICLLFLYLCYYFVIMNKYNGLILTFLIFLCINGSIQEVPYQFMFILLSAQLLTEVKKKGYLYENC
jgi:hypothetical protein